MKQDREGIVPKHSTSCSTQNRKRSRPETVVFGIDGFPWPGPLAQVGLLSNVPGFQSFPHAMAQESIILETYVRSF